MRILHTIDSAGLYGAERVLLTLATEQKRRGDAPTILSIGNLSSPPKAIEIEAAQLGIECIALRMNDGLNLRGARDILRAATERDTDVIHSHGYKTNILLALVPRRTREVAVVTTLHGWTAKKAFSKLGLYRFLDRRLLPRLDAIVSVSPIAIPGNTITVIPNGICAGRETVPDDAIAASLRELKARTTALVGAVGRLSPEKNFGALFDALKALPEGIGAAILGDGPEAAALQARIQDEDLASRVLMPGYVRDAARYLPLFDVLTIPSLTEGLPMILLEAMSAALPVVATKVGDIPGTLADAGALVEPGDAADLAAAISLVAADLPGYRERAVAGARRVQAEYGASQMASRYDAVYRAASARMAPAESSSARTS